MKHKLFTFRPSAEVTGSFGALRCLMLIGLLACLSPTIALGWAPEWVRAVSAGGNGYTLARAIKVAPNNDYYVTGQFSSSATFSGTTLVSRGGADIFLAKYEASGKLLWIVTAGGPGDDVGWGLDLDRQGNIYLTGWFTDSGTFDATNKESKTVHGVGNTIFLAKYRPWGHLVWVQTGMVTDSSVYNFGYGVAVDSAAHTVYLAALSQGNTTFSSENGTNDTVSGVGTWHMVVAKYDTDGNFKWAQTNEGSPNSVPYGIAVDAKDNAYVTGWLEDATTFSSADGKDITIVGFSPAQTDTNYPDDAFLAKYDKGGNVKWVNHIGGYKAIGNAVAVSRGGEVSIAGLIGNIDFGSPGEAETIVTSQPPGENIDLGGGHFTDPFNVDVVIATFNTAGVLQRALRYGSSENEVANAIAYDDNGSLYIAGQSKDTTGSQKLFVRKYWDGKLVWKQEAENAGLWLTEGSSPALSLGAEGEVFVTGGYQGKAHFGKIELSGVGSSDMFVAELARISHSQ